MIHDPSDPFASITKTKPSYPLFPYGATSLASRCLTREIFELLIDRRTSSGFTLVHALNSGVSNPDSHIGIYAGDAECYTTFAPIFDPIITSYHGLEPPPDSSGHSRIPCDQPNHTILSHPLSLPDPDPEKKFIRSTRIRIARNLTDFPFTPIINAVDRNAVEKKIIDACSKMPKDFNGIYYPLEGPHLQLHDSSKEKENPRQARQTVNTPKNQKPDFFIAEIDDKAPKFRKGDRFQDAAGINRDWPHSRGIFQSMDGRFAVWVNEEDHLRIVSLRKDGEISAAFNHLQSGVRALEQTLSFARSKALGYLTACPTNLGTGMRAGVHIKLPKLSQNLDALKAMADTLHLQIRGTQGEKTEVEDSVFDISNSQRLGITEQECCKVLHEGVCRLIAMEKI